MKNKIKVDFFNDQIHCINYLRDNDMIDDNVHIIYSVVSNNCMRGVIHGHINETMAMLMTMLEDLYQEAPTLCLSELIEFIGKTVEKKKYKYSSPGWNDPVFFYPI